VRAGTQGHGGKVSARVFPELLGPGSRCARPGHESDGIRAAGIYENGISRALVLDYNDFAISGELTSLEIRDTKPCK
jgi:hypothetical protein